MDPRSEDGVTLLSFVFLFALTLMGMAFILLMGRAVIAQSAIQAAVEDGVRAASIEQTYGGAQGVALSTISESLRGSQLRCDPLEVVGPTGDVSQDIPRGSFIEVRASCNVPISDLMFLRSPGDLRVSASSVERVDVYRGES